MNLGDDYRRTACASPRNTEKPSTSVADVAASEPALSSTSGISAPNGDRHRPHPGVTTYPGHPGHVGRQDGDAGDVRREEADHRRRQERRPGVNDEPSTRRGYTHTGRSY